MAQTNAQKAKHRKSKRCTLNVSGINNFRNPKTNYKLGESSIALKDWNFGKVDVVILMKLIFNFVCSYRGQYAKVGK